MKTDTYTKAVLTVIGICLTIIVLKDNNIITTAHASSTSNINNTRFATVPINEDGSINIKVSDVINVNIEEVNGRYVREGIPVVINK